MLTLRVVVAIAGVTTVAMLPIGCGPTSPRSTLVGASSSDYPPRFEFVDRPDAASLMECLGAAETLVVTVDTEQDAMAVRREDETSPVVVWTAQASFVDARLLTGESGCVRVGRDMAEPARTDVEAAVGSSLSGYVFAARVAPDPVSLARSVLAVASDITQSESSSGELTVSVVVDGSVGELEGLEAGSIPDLRFRIVDGRIASVGARLPSGEEDSFGFVWEYNGVSGVAEVVPPLVATDVEDVVALIGSGDRGQNDCEL